MAANELKKDLDSRRTDVDRAVAKLLRQLKLPKNFSGEIEYNGYTIRIQQKNNKVGYQQIARYYR